MNASAWRFFASVVSHRGSGVVGFGVKWVVRGFCSSQFHVLMVVSLGKASDERVGLLDAAGASGGS